jgi:hypothetical protein
MAYHNRLLTLSRRFLKAANDLSHQGGQGWRYPVPHYLAGHALELALKAHRDVIDTGRTLAPGEYGQFCTDDFRGFPPSENISAMWALDTLGRRHQASRADVEKVRQDLPRERASGDVH